MADIEYVSIIIIMDTYTKAYTRPWYHAYFT